MIERLVGQCVLKQSGALVLDVNGVGYGVEMTDTALAGIQEGDRLTLWTHLHVSEDAHRLFGFPAHGDRVLFDLLLSVSGVGPRHALAIVGALDARVLYEAVESEDPSGLPKVPHVGKTMWEKILLGLKPKSKLERLAALSLALPAATAAALKTAAAVPLFEGARRTGLAPALLGDLRSALENFGYKDKELQPVLKRFEREPPAKDLASLVRLALAELAGSLKESKRTAEELF